MTVQFGRRIRRACRLLWEWKLVALSGLFDSEWYVAHNLNVAGAGENPVLHYLRYGATQGRNPHPLFDTAFYLEKYPDIAAAGCNPLVHFLRHGTKELRNPHPLFDTAYYLEKYPDIAAAGCNPLVHFLRHGAKELRNPHPLFDTAYYLEKYSHVTAAGCNPLIDFLRAGAKETRSPHPLFDAGFYREKYPDVVGAGFNPLIHFARVGARDGRQPCQDFDTGFYLASNPDIAKSDVNPLVHYLRYGAEEFRSPHPAFDTAYYVQTYPDVAAGRMNPLVHYVRYGRAEGRRSTRRPVGWPRKASERDRQCRVSTAEGAPIDVIVPVFRGVEETKSCLESVLSARCQRPYRLVVVNDCSPEPELNSYLRKLRSTATSVEVIDNPHNLGFVSSVNTAMNRNLKSDVVLLNSDTIVSNDWLDRLSATAYSAEDIGTVTPFSNNATICSYPLFCQDNAVPQNVDLAQLDRAFAEMNPGAVVDMPTAVGFCMYIRRQCLNDTGLFDATAFGQGYGEENDFCMRATSKGWRHALAADVFVYHKGAASFDRIGERQHTAMEILLRLHPSYQKLVRMHVENDPAECYRLAVTAHRLRNDGKQVILGVTHAIGGGVARHLNDLRQATAEDAHWLILKPGHSRLAVLECEDRFFEFSISIDPSSEYSELVEFLRACGVNRMHVHHLLGHAIDIEKLHHDLRVPLDFTVHDYYSICPQITLSDKEFRYCGEPDERGCNRCIEERSPDPYLDIVSWRLRNAWACRSAARVIAPSIDAAERMARHIGRKDIIAAEHPGSPIAATPRPRSLQEDETLRVAVLGTMTFHKGLDSLQSCAQIALREKLPISFTLIGDFDKDIHWESSPEFKITGEYKEEELSELLAEVRPHVIWLPVRIPETFSYTLSTCLEHGIPVVAPKIGALSERLSGRQWTWTYPWESDSRQLIELFLRVRSHFLSGDAPACTPVHRKATNGFYPGNYLQRQSAGLEDIREDNRFTVIAVPSTVNTGQIQAAGYIRVILPWGHPTVSDLVRLELASARGALNKIAHAVLVQRTVVSNMKLAEELVNHCRKNGMLLLYETDDDLIDMPSFHPEHEDYAPSTAAAAFLATRADWIFTATETLRQKLVKVNQNVLVLPNAIDERLWLDEASETTDDDDVVRILYMGTTTHRDDLALLEEPIRSLSRDHGSRIEFEIVGVLPDSVRPEWCKVAKVPPRTAQSYPEFVRWLRRSNRWSIGLAPLLDNPFNKCKSYLKFLEYSALGLAGIYANNSSFNEVVIHDETGLLTGNSVAEWREALERLIQSRELRSRLRTASRATLQRHTLKAQSNWRRDIFCRVLAREGAGARPQEQPVGTM